MGCNLSILLRVDTEFFHSRKKSRAVHSQARGSTVGAAHAPLARSQGPYDLIALLSFIFVSSATFETCAWNRHLLARCIHAIAGALPIVSHIGRAKPFYASSPHWGRQPKSVRTPTIVDSNCPADEPGTRCPAASFCLTNMSSQS